MKRSKQTADIEDRKRKESSSLVDYSQSFVSNATKKFVNISLPDVQIKGKQFYKKQPYCLVCFRNFTTTFRQHHCRVCSNAVCHDCSKSMVNKERSCDICILKLSNPQEDRKKKQMLETLETLCAYLIYRKKQKMEQLEQIKSCENNESEEIEQLERQNKIMKELQKQNQGLQKSKQDAEKELSSLRQKNQKIEQEISKFTTLVFQDDY